MANEQTVDPQMLELLKWLCISLQLAAWAWFSAKGGRLADKHFLLFTAGMMLGQIAASFETFFAQAWGTFVIQVYFLAFTGYGGLKRLQSMKETARVQENT